MKKSVVKVPKVIKNVAKGVKKGAQGARKVVHALDSAVALYEHPSLGNLKNFTASIRGKGDYVINGNSITTEAYIGDTAMQMPRFTTGERSLRVRHQEYLGDVYSSGTANTFAITKYVINPGAIETFPWLRRISQNYDKWVPNGIVFGFKSTSSSFNGTDQSLGTVIMATDYDVTDAAYASKSQMENSEFAASCATNNCMLHPIECASRELDFKNYWVRSSLTLPSGESAKFYDVGNFYVATAGISGTNVNLGELWVTYDITFTKEQLEPDAGLLYSRYEATTGLGTWFPTGAAIDVDSTFAITVESSKITFPSYLVNQCFKVCCYYVGTATSMTSPTLTFSNCRSGPALTSGSSVYLVPNAVSSITAQYNFSVVLTGPNASVTFSAGTPMTSPTRMVLELTQIPSG